jgi:hypothetical protein
LALTSALIKKGFSGSQRYEIRSYTQSSSADVGGDITFSWLKRVLYAEIQEKSAGTIAAGAVINETFPLAGNVVTIVTQGSSDGYIMAWGDPV